MAAEKNTPQTAQTTAKAGANDSRSQEVLSNSLEAQGAVGATALKVGQPGENIAEVVGVESGKTYVLDFTQASIINAAIKGGDLVVEFANGASVVLKGYKAASDVTLQMADGRAVTAEQLINLSTAQTDQPSQEQLTEPAPANENAPQEQVNLLEQQLETTEKPVMNGVEQLTEAEQVSLENLPPEVAEALAEQLAEIDPAAGDAQGPGNSPQNSGLGFGSSFESQGVIGLADVGPIDPTALRYQLPEFEEKLFINEDIDPIQPTLDPKDPETEQSLEGAYKVYEDGSIQLLLEALPDMDDSILTITIKGIPSTWTVTGEGTYDPLTQTWTITTGIGESFFGGPIVKPPADSDIDLQDLIFTVVEYNPGTGQTGTATEIVDIIVDAVADTPEVEAPDNTGLEGAHLDVSITGQAGDTDGSEVIVKYQITGLPEGFTFNKGSLVSPGVWELAPGDIVGLKAIPPNDDYYGSINLNVTVFTTESPISDLDFDNTNDDAQATDPFTLTWLPVCDPPEVFIDLPKDPDTGVKNALVYEDNSIGVRVVGNLAPGGTPQETLTLKVTGIDLTKLDNLVLEGEAGANWVRVPGSPDNAAAYTITLPAGTNYDGIFTFTPKAQSDLDLTGMKVTGTSYEPATDTTSSANEDSFNVLVDAVADKPSIVADDATGDEGKPIALNIAGQLGVDNFDGSESITGYLIKGPLTGFTFTDALGAPVGTKVSDTEWSFTPAQIAGLKIVPPTADFNGVLNLTATVLTKDTATDIDFDTTNNTNSAEDPFKITWDQDDQPIVGQAVETVDESFLEITETGNVNVNYGVDGPGKVTVNGEFTSGGSLMGGNLTSGGVPVTIALAAVPGYALYEGFAGTTKVFSLKVFENGSYEYKQFVALDHADGNNPNDIIVLNFGITATDADGDATKGTIVINVKDDAPTAVNDKFCVEPSDDAPDAVNDNGGSITTVGTVKTGNVTTNDDKGNDLPTVVTHVNGQSVHATNGLTISGSYGTLTIYQNGSYEYTSTKHGMGKENFTYTLTDKDGDFDTAVLSFDLSCPPPAQNPPVAVDNTYKVFELDAKAISAPVGATVIKNGKATYTLTGGATVYKDTGTDKGGFWYKLPILGNDSDPDGDNIIITKIYNIQGLPKNSSVVLDASGKFVIAKIGQDGNTKASTITFEYQITDGKGGYDTAKVTVCIADHNSPLVLDLDGDGVELTGSVPGVQFDIDNDGSKEQVGWVGKDDGLLAIDTNNNGTIDSQNELFGNNNTHADGFANLASHDGNNDGKIDALDAIFAQLRVWRDANSDGISQSGELFTLTQLDIKSISLAAQTVSDVIAGNQISHTSTFTYNDGTTGEIVDAWFETIENPNATPVIETPAKTLSERTATGNVLANDNVGNDDGASVIAIKFGDKTYQIPAGGQISINGQHGYLTINSTGAFVFTAFVGETVQAEDVFTYTMRDFDGDTSSANVTLCVKPDNGDPTDDQPDAVNDNGGTITVVGTVKTGNVMNNDDKGDDLPTVVTRINNTVVDADGVTINGLYGTLFIKADGSYTYTSTQHVVGNEVFTYTITDVDGDSDSATLTFNLNCPAPHDDQPDAVNDNGGNITTVGTVKTGNVMTNDDKGDDLPTIVTHVNGTVVGTNGLTINGLYGTLVIQQNGSYTYTSTKHAMANEVFTYTITDVDGDSDSANLTFTLECAPPHDDKPIVANGASTVDETGGFDTVSGSVTVNYGQDGPGTVKGSGTFGSTYAIKSNGSPVSVGLVGDTYTGKDASDRTVFTLKVNADGSYTFQQFRQIDHADPLNPDDAVNLTFGIIATDADGDTGTGSIVITVKDDGPTAVNDGNYNVNLGQAISGNVTTNDTLSKDVLNKITSVFEGDAGYIMPESGTLTIQGLRGTLVIKSDGSYTYTAKANATAGAESFTYTITDADGDSSHATLSFNVKTCGCGGPDDKPIVANATETVDETFLNITEPGTVTVNYGQDGPGTITGNNTFAASGSMLGNSLKSNNVAVGVTYANGLYTGKAGATTVFTLKVNANGTYEYKQFEQLDHANGNDANDIITLTFGITATDADGDTGNGSIIINVKDDAPLAVNDNGGTFTGINQSKNGNVLTNDDVGEDIPGKVTKVGTTNIATNGTVIQGTYGTLTIKADGSYTYTTTKHGMGTETFTYTMQDYDGDTSTAKLTFGIECPAPDDKPIVPNATETVDESFLNITEPGTVTVNYGNDGPGTVAGNNTFAASGSMLGGTLKSNNVAVGVTYANGLYTGKAGATTVFTLKVNANGTYEYKQFEQLDHADGTNANDIITLTFGITATDADGDTGNGSIIINVRDDAPLAVNDNGGSFTAINQSKTGNVLTNDDVGNDIPGKVTKIGNTVVGTNGLTINGLYGTLVIKQDGSYTYTTNKHGMGDDVFTYTMQDYDGDTSTAKLTFNISCPEIDDKPIVANAVETVDETGLVITETGTVTVNYGGDGPGTIAGNNLFSSSGSRTNDTLTSNGVAIAVTFAGGVYTGKAGATTVFTLKVNANGTYEYKQFEPLDHADGTNPNDIITLNFGITATDADGDTGKGSIIVHVKDDAPKAYDDVGGVMTSLKQIRTGNVLTNDDKSQDTPNLVYKVNGKSISNAGTIIHGTYGKLVIKSDGSYTYQATKYGTGTETFNYIMNDFDKDQSGAKLTFTINNPPPKIILNDNFATIWGDFSYVQYSLFANDGPNGNGTNLSPGQRVYSVVYNGTTYSVPNGGSKVVSIPNGSVQFWSNGTVKFSQTKANQATRFDEFTVNVTDSAGNYASQPFSTSQLKDSSPTNETAEVTGSGARDIIFGDSSGSDTIRGGANHDFIYGDSSAGSSGAGDKLYGDDGDDYIQGYYGNDTMYGGNGNDIMFGDANDSLPLDRVIYEGNGSIIANGGPASSGSYAGNDVMYGEAGDDYMFGGNGNDTMDGGADDDYLRGGNGNDTIYGGTGNDVIEGMDGNDVLYGGAGADLFLMTAIGDARDTIKDFNIAEGDQLGLSDLLSGYDKLQDSLDDFVFARTSGGNTIISVNASGNGNASQAVDVFILEGRTLTLQELENKNAIVA